MVEVKYLAEEKGPEDDRKTGKRVIIRDSFLPLLTVPRTTTAGIKERLFQPYRNPLLRKRRVTANYAISNKKRLGCLALGGSSLPQFSKNFVVPRRNSTPEETKVFNSIHDIKTPPYIPLILWDKVTDASPPGINATETTDRVIVPENIGRFLRPHQRIGMKFLFDSVMNLNQERTKAGFGCILADDMGLGKTLQSITLMYTLLTCSFMKKYGPPIIKRCIVVCPTSLVKNWENEINKWLQARLEVYTVAESTKKAVVKIIKRYVASRTSQVLIISYDTFRLHRKLFNVKEGSQSICDLLICDEGHRLKNCESLISKSLASLSCLKRVLLSGTPLQNDLEEFYALVNFVNPLLLGSLSQFRKTYINPLTIGRDPDALRSEIEKSEKLKVELSNIVNVFILRRTNKLNVKYLPPKMTQVVCVKLSPIQQDLYNHVLSNKNLKQQIQETTASKKKTGHIALNSINLLKKICNHGQLVLNETKPDFRFEPIFAKYSSCIDPAKTNLEFSSKFQLVISLLAAIKKHKLDDKLVIVSNYTQTLQLLSTLCKEFNIRFVRLDGSVSSKKRNAMVEELNALNSKLQVFLLSSKAGGCGLNLIGANRLILFDPDWNPATDKQAAARVWREGQKKNTYVYRFLATGSIEEKIFQRQISKNGLQSVVAAEIDMESSFSSRDLRDIFSLNMKTTSDTHDKYNCKRCKDIASESNCRSLEGEVAKKLNFGVPRKKNPGEKRRPNCPQIGFPTDDELELWKHYSGWRNLEDEVLREACRLMGNDSVSFIFSQYIDGSKMSEDDLKDKPSTKPRMNSRKSDTKMNAFEIDDSSDKEDDVIILSDLDDELTDCDIPYETS